MHCIHHPGRLLPIKSDAVHLVNAPAPFERLMERVLGGIAGTECLIYLDDILVLGLDFASTLERLAASS